MDTATGELAVTHEADIPLPSPSLEAEGTTFVDIASGDWFARRVATCAREGIMTGTGEDTFSPEDWGYMTIDTDDGRLHREGFSGDSNVWGYTILTSGGERYIYVKPKDMEMLSLFHGYPRFGDSGATVTLEGTAYHGPVVMTRQVAYQTYFFTFRPDDPEVTGLLVAAQNIPDLSRENSPDVFRLL